MGEYATHKGESIKIGTCEDLYYLRADQRGLIEGYNFAECLEEIRFRFPFPDEDELEPGAFDDHDRGVRVPRAWTLPADWTGHYSVQFRADPGYLLSIPCPEQYGRDESGRTTLPGGLTVHRNGWSGGPRLVQQGYREGEWRAIVACGSCGAKWNLPRAAGLELALAFREEAARTEWQRLFDRETGEMLDDYGHVPVHSDEYRRELETISDRIAAGYGLNPCDACGEDLGANDPHALGCPNDDEQRAYGPGECVDRAVA